MTPKFHTLQIADINKETKNSVSIAFSIPEELKNDYSFIPGQYLTLKAMVNGEEVRRSYSLCTAPYENEYRVAVKQVPEGKFSTYANKSLKVGDSIDVMTPTGNFQLKTDANNENSYVLVAAGSGITPILSILKSILKEEPKSDVTLFYGNKGIKSVMFFEEIEGLKNKHMDQLNLIHVFSRENLGNDLQNGRIDADKAKELYTAFLKEKNIDAVYICGPESMILGVKDSLTEQGIDSSKIHFELFTSPDSAGQKIQQPKNSPKIESNVTIILDDDQFDLHLASTEDSILEAGRAAGADLPFSCKGGVCCTCKAKIIEGSASMDVNYALEPEEVEAGYILSCQSHPTSEKLVISFDD